MMNGLTACTLLIAAALASGCHAADSERNSDAQRSKPSTLKVMTFNIRYGSASDGENVWPNRQDAVCEMIRRHDPDLLGVQEALAFQVQHLAQQFPDREWVGVGRDDGREEGEFAPAFYRRARFERLDWGTWWLSDTPDVPGSVSWDSSLTRIATWVALRERSTGRELVFVNTHFDHRGREARRQSAALLRRKIPALAGTRPVVLAGDFNAPPGGAVHQILLGRDRRGQNPDVPVYMDANQALGQGPTPGSSHGFRGGTSGSRIDWIVYSPPLEAVSARVVAEQIDNRWPSDHHPVVAELRWP